jgi:4-amino-4-deoxy-L-arabinose transferase-like glycosyltransferase
MTNKAVPRSSLRGDLILLVALALLRLLIQCATDGKYGFHRDELGVLDDGRYLDWGYVSYPPFTPFIARIALALFGPSLIGLRFFAVLAQSIAMVLTGLMARELGARRRAQAIAALAAAIAPMSICMGTMFQYIAFDYLWWVLAAYLVVRLIRSGEARWWMPIGAALGLGMMTKYTMIFFIAGLVAGVLLTPARHYLKSRWLWAGALLSLLIFLPNLIWQIKHDFISLTFLNHIHARDVEMGRADGFFVQQLLVNASIFTFPLWIAGLYYYFVGAEGRPYRVLGWMFIVPLLLFFFAHGRFYYMAPAYPMLFAAGAIVWDEWLTRRSRAAARAGQIGTWTALARARRSAQPR